MDGDGEGWALWVRVDKEERECWVEPSGVWTSWDRQAKPGSHQKKKNTQTFLQELVQLLPPILDSNKTVTDPATWTIPAAFFSEAGVEKVWIYTHGSQH